MDVNNRRPVAVPQTKTPLAAQTSTATQAVAVPTNAATDRGRDAVKQGVVAAAPGALHGQRADAHQSPLHTRLDLLGAPKTTLPTAIAGTRADGKHESDAWGNAVIARFHDSPSIRDGSKHQFQVMGEAVRTALAAPDAKDAPASLLDFAQKNPPEAGASVRITVEEFQGQKLWSYVSITPAANERSEIDLQLFSTKGRVVGVLAGIDDEFLVAPA